MVDIPDGCHRRGFEITAVIDRKYEIQEFCRSLDDQELTVAALAYVLVEANGGSIEVTNHNMLAMVKIWEEVQAIKGRMSKGSETVN